MAKPGMAQMTERSNTHKAVARRTGRSITLYLLRVRAYRRQTEDPNEIRMRRRGLRSVQLKIKSYGRNYIDLLTVYRSRFCPPLFHCGDGGIGEHRFAFKKFLHFDTAVLLHPHLEPDDTVQAGSLSECRIRWLRGIEERPLEIPRILLQASPKVDFQTCKPAFQPVRPGCGGSRHLRGDR